MDISTIENKLHSGMYDSGYHFAMDVRLIWSNSFFYNASNSDLFSATMDLSILFERLFKGNDELAVSSQKDFVENRYKRPDQSSKGSKGIQNRPMPVPVPVPVPAPVVASKPVSKPPTQAERPMGFLEKKQLCQNIKKLEPKYLKGVLDIVKECMDIKGEELEFDVEKLPPRVARDLDKYVKNCLQSISRAAKIKKPGTVEGIKAAQEANLAKIQEINGQIEGIKQIPVNEVYMPEVESESESSSSSESDEEEEVPSIQREENSQNYNKNYSSMVDFDKLY